MNPKTTFAVEEIESLHELLWQLCCCRLYRAVAEGSSSTNASVTRTWSVHTSTITGIQRFRWNGIIIW